jgi:hypothetical protein
MNVCNAQNSNAPYYNIFFNGPQSVIDGINTTVIINISTGLIQSMVNITIKCLNGRDCSNWNYTNVFIPANGLFFTINYSIIPHINLSTYSIEFFTVNVYNESYKVTAQGSFYASIIPSISWEILPGSYNSKKIYNNLGMGSVSYNGYYHYGVVNKIKCKYVNVNPKTEISGNLQARLVYYGRDISQQILTIDRNFYLPPSGSKIYEINPPQRNDIKYSDISIDMMYSKNNTNPPVTLSFIDSEKKNYYVYVFFLVTKGIVVTITNNQDPNSISIWNGTKLNVTIFNGFNKTVNDCDVLVQDKVNIFSSFYFKRYWNSTRISFGTLRPYETKYYNFTIYSKISGYHDFSTIVVNRPESTEGASIVYINSGLRLTYLDEQEVIWHCPDKYKSRSECTASITRSSTIGDNYILKVAIENPAQYHGDFSFSAIPYEIIGITDNGASSSFSWGSGFADTRLNGNGWATMDDFVELNPITVPVNEKNTTLSITIKPKMSGGLGLIPYLKVGNKVLLFDDNIQRSEYPGEQKINYDSCEGNEIFNEYRPIFNNPTEAFICVKPHDRSTMLQYSIFIPLTVPIAIAVISAYWVYRYKNKFIKVY